MNIPDEIGEQALKADDTWVFIAEWARKEALREAASEHFRQSLAAGMGDPTAVAEWLRALAEGDN